MTDEKIWMLFLMVVTLLIGGCNSSSIRETNKIIGDTSYGWSDINHAPYEGGVLAKLNRLYAFDETSKQMLPLCTRSECLHESEDCPAVLIGGRACAAVLYEGKIWYLCQNKSVWEFWSADLDGENQKLQCKVEMGDIQPGAEHLFYQGKYYTVAWELVINEETGEADFWNFVMELDLQSGAYERCTEEAPISANMFLVGAYGENLYYTEVITNEDGTLARNIYEMHLETGDVKVIGQSGWCTMDGKWMTYMQIGQNGEWEIILRDLATGDTSIIDRMQPRTMNDLVISGERIIVNGNDEAGMYNKIYDMVERQWEAAAPMETTYMRWFYQGGGWLITAMNPEAAHEANAEDWYYYISEEDLLAGKEPTRVK